MSWPEAKTVAASFKGTVSEVIRTPLGPAKGIRSGTAHVYVIQAPKPLMFCESCGAAEPVPDPPGSGGPGEPRNPLVAPGTRAHALFALTKMHEFEKEHAHAPSPEEV